MLRKKMKRLKIGSNGAYDITAYVGQKNTHF